jgi:hypothetical protein
VSASTSLVRQIGFAPRPRLASPMWDRRSPPATSKPHDLRLIRDYEGIPLVYDEQTGRLAGDDPTLAAAVSEPKTANGPIPPNGNPAPTPCATPASTTEVDTADEDHDDDDLEPLDIEERPAGNRNLSATRSAAWPRHG